MAITPKELEAKKKTNAKAFLDELEKKIDKQLLEKTYNASMMTVDIESSDYTKLYDAAIFEELEKRYNGWLVRKACGGRQGDEYYHLTFVDKKKVASPGPMEEFNSYDAYMRR